MDIDPVVGLPPVDTGTRQTFDPDSFEGADATKLQLASDAAAAVGGVVVMHRVYETDRVVFARSGVMYTGGGIRRSCTPVATTVADAGPEDMCLVVDDARGFSPGQSVALVEGRSASAVVTLLTLASIEGAHLCAYQPIGAPVRAGLRAVRYHDLLDGTPTFTDSIVIDSVLFDGAFRCNGETNSWVLNGAVSLRGPNVIRRSIINDSPGESLTTCGAVVEENRAFGLQGSLVHKSCESSPEPRDFLRDNYVDGANLATNAVVGHSEGLVTLSAFSGTISTSGNVFRGGREGVFGIAGREQEGIAATRDCYAHFPRVITLLPDARPAYFTFDADLIDVPVVFDGAGAVR